MILITSGKTCDRQECFVQRILFTSSRQSRNRGVFFPSLSRCLLPNTPATLTLNPLLGRVSCANYVQNGEKDPSFFFYCYFLFLTVKRRKCGFTLLRSAKGLYNIYSKVFIWKLHFFKKRPQPKKQSEIKKISFF